MTREEWEQITRAAQLLGLDEQATLDEIKKAFRRLSKKHQASKKSTEKVEMYKLTDAYHLLLEYCANFAFPLAPGEDESLEGDDWWFERFGEDHLWGKGDGSKRQKRK